MKIKPIYLVPLCLLSLNVFASERATLSFTLDNDGVFGVDQDYTNGVFFNFATGAINPYPIFSPLSLSYWDGASLDKFEFALGHKMYTPSDIETKAPLINDRPYAGYLHTEFNYISLHPQQAQRFNLTLGTTGESSLADEAQDIVHGITGSDEPNGWEYQVEDKFIGSVGYLSHFNIARIRSIANTDWEISNVSEVNVGNFRSDVSTGFMLRWGADLAGSMGAANIDNENPFRASMLGASKSGWFLYAGVEGRYRFNDFTVEGDRPGIEDNPSISNPDAYDVSLQNLQASGVAGIAIYGHSFGATLSATAKTPDYEHAPESVYGTGSVSLYAFF